MLRIKQSEDKETVERINKGLQENFEKYGKRYCPCSLIKNDDTVCPCKEFLDNIKAGKCHCGKYEKIEVENC